jgi:hypothetical protein
MLPKEHNNTYIHHLRVIHLYEADFSLLLRVKWRRFILHSLNHEIINQSQYGSLPEQDSLVLVLFCFVLF